jgi:hypothetical protein
VISEISKQRKRADELSQIWESYFPALPVGIEYWMVALEGMPFGVLVKGIKHTARKRVQLRGNMTLDQMMTYLDSSCTLTLKQEIEAGIYKADQFKGAALAKVAPNRSAPAVLAAATEQVTNPKEACK